ncbi:hypothetical protein Q1695_012640 [Nippostrongylus brasiliensis]|nr:hypothetical protein Q1695_012640 [Nippostrongylus brasiliensis]
MGGFLSSEPRHAVSDLYEELEKTRIERQLAIQQLLEQRQRAYKLAEEREKLNWTASGGAVMSVFCALSAFHHKNMLHLLPLFPTLSYLGYQAHYCHGDKITIIRESAKNLLHENLDQVAPSALSVEDVRHRTKELNEMKRDEELFL